MSTVKLSPLVIGVCGGSGSGKTTLAAMLAERLSGRSPVVLCQDSYYRDLAHLPAEERDAVDFDHPDAIEWALLTGDLRRLKDGGGATPPVYDFTHHRRTGRETLGPSELIIVEGHLILAVEEVRDLLDVKIFLDVPREVMFLRRVRRDMIERGRSFLSVAYQYEKTVLPSLLSLVEPSGKWADVVLPDAAVPEGLDGLLGVCGFYGLASGKGA